MKLQTCELPRKGLVFQSSGSLRIPGSEGDRLVSESWRLAPDGRITDNGDTVLVKAWSPATSIHQDKGSDFGVFTERARTPKTQDRRRCVKRCTPTTLGGTIYPMVA